MAKDKNKVKVEEIRQEISKRYKDEIAGLKSELKETRIENNQLKDRVRELEGEIDSLKDWVSRMQEFVNMEPEEFQKMLENERKRSELDDSMSKFNLLFGNILKSFSSLGDV